MFQPSSSHGNRCAVGEGGRSCENRESEEDAETEDPVMTRRAEVVQSPGGTLGR